MRRGCSRALAVAALLGLAHAVPAADAGAPAPACARPVYLTFDTGHMGVAPLVAEVLARHGVQATFFLANERTREADGTRSASGSSLDDRWEPWWRARAAEGHAFGSHTWDHGVWRADLPPAGEAAAAGPRFVLQPTQGAQAGQRVTLDEAALCTELRRPAERFAAMTGQTMSAIWRAPGGRSSPALLAAARRCGFTHVGWSPAGFLGDELPSDRHPNAALLARALRDVKAGDILLAHLGIWSRQDPWAPAVLEPLVAGLKARGLCFATLREHPLYGAAARTPVAAGPTGPVEPRR